MVDSEIFAMASSLKSTSRPRKKEQTVSIKAVSERNERAVTLACERHLCRLATFIQNFR